MLRWRGGDGSLVFGVHEKWLGLGISWLWACGLRDMVGWTRGWMLGGVVDWM